MHLTEKVSLISVMNTCFKILYNFFGELMQGTEEIFLSLQSENESRSEFELF